MNDNIAILYNPSSNSGKSIKQLNFLKKTLLNNEINANIFVSDSPEKFKDLAKSLAEDYHYLGIAGGDSSYTIAINTLMKNNIKKLPSIFFIPTGSSNDIPREFGILNLGDSIKAIKKGKVKFVDLGVLKYNSDKIMYFLGQANIGLGVEVNHFVEKIKRGKFPVKNQFILGLYSVIKTYLTKSGIKLLKIVLDEKEEIEGKFLISLFSKIRFWATGKKIFPISSINNGRINFLALSEVGFFRLLKINNKLKKQENFYDENVIIKNPKRIKVFSKYPFYLQVDGEIVSKNYKNIEVNGIEIFSKEKILKILSLS